MLLLIKLHCAPARHLSKNSFSDIENIRWDLFYLQGQEDQEDQHHPKKQQTNAKPDISDDRKTDSNPDNDPKGTKTK